MNVKRLETFITLIETKSFSKTAQKLNMTQPAVSQQLKLFEKEMGTALLDRERFTLTKTGEIVLTKGREIVQSIENMQTEVKLADHQIAGLLKLGASTVASTHLIPRLLASVTQKHPSLRFHIQVADTMQMIKKVYDGDCDLAIVGTDKVDHSFVSHPVYTDRFVLIASPEWNIESDMESIVKKPFISREKTSGTQHEVEKLLKREKISINEMNSIATVQDTEAVIAFVENGLGISIISQLSGSKAIEEKRVQVVHMFDSTRTFSLIYHRNNENDPVIQAVKTICNTNWDGN
ncbi:selenium metabolism-associated LysR family transcriptional regulator [Salipaludibacillus daqingensis]|uniref:selenium metabolism-associated LysR family transcriptional regulator n=1 Tax=Salipaludibacillus daqingensis TaxID=3041001 RepID=UPI002475BA0F|nr:selenium metabolism-associated LysR family transcriptional regulator [Salipaludibacillus daqingensis]